MKADTNPNTPADDTVIGHLERVAREFKKAMPLVAAVAALQHVGEDELQEDDRSDATFEIVQQICESLCNARHSLAQAQTKVREACAVADRFRAGTPATSEGGGK